MDDAAPIASTLLADQYVHFNLEFSLRIVSIVVLLSSFTDLIRFDSIPPQFDSIRFDSPLRFGVVGPQ